MVKQVGIQGNVLSWIKPFFYFHQDKVVLQDGLSSWQKVISGVPQGSILGTILFFIYVNDIPDWIKSTAKLFDDIKL